MIYVIRHGQVDTNVSNQVNGWNDELLNDVGIKQSISVGNQLKDTIFDVVFCSPLSRARQTYKNLNIKNVPVIYDDRIKERNSASMVYADVKILDSSIWYDQTKQIVYKDSEGFGSIISRTDSLLKDIIKNYKNKNVLIVTHGDICKAIYLYFNTNHKDVSKFEQDNCEIVSYDF